MKPHAALLTGFTLTLLLSETELSSDLLLFFLVGAIPGTNYSLSSDTMLALIGLVASLIGLRLIRSYGLHYTAGKLLVRAYHTAKQQFAKRSLEQA